MASKPKTPKPVAAAPRELFEPSAVSISIGATGKFSGSINARELPDGDVILEEVNRRGTTKMLHRLSPDLAIALGLRLIAAGRRAIT